MKNFSLVLVLLLFTSNTFAQSDSGFWLGMDASYWKKSVKSSSSFGLDQENFSSIRPMLGMKINKKWDVGIMMSINSYQEELSPLVYTSQIPIVDDQGNEISQDSQTTVYQTAINNQLFGVGIFARRNFMLNEKFSFNLSPYILRESGDEGTLNLYFPTYFQDPCINCLSIFPGPIEIPVTEENWRFGVDAAFAFQATNWMKLEVRANLMELRRQSLSDDRISIANDLAIYDPFQVATSGYFGSYSDFGSAISREGIRFGFVISPF